VIKIKIMLKKVDNMKAKNRKDAKALVALYALLFGFALLFSFSFFVVLGVAWSLSPLFGLSVVVGVALGLLIWRFGFQYQPQYNDTKALLTRKHKMVWASE